MKKIIAWILTLCMVLGLLCGCSDTSSSKRRSNRKDRDKDKETVEDRVDDDREDDRDDKEDQKDSIEVSVEETVIYDENDIKVTVTGMTEGYSGLDVKILVENNTEHNIALSGDVFLVNGITMSGWLYTTVAAGKKANDTLTFYYENMQLAGIEALATVTCVDARIVDTDSYETLFEIPFAFETSVAGSYEQKIDDSGEVIFQDADVTIIYKTITDSFMGKQVVMLVKNDTGKDITVEIDDASINGYTVSAWMYDSVLAGSVRFCVLDFYSSTLEENGIENVEEVCFYVQLRYADDWETFSESDELTIKAD